MRIGIYAGYAPVLKPHAIITKNYEIEDWTGGYGSERSLFHLAKGLVGKGHYVEMFNRIHISMPEFDASKFDVVIAQRYLHYWLYEEFKGVPVVFYLHDTTPIPYYAHRGFHDDGKAFFSNVGHSNLCAKIVSLTPSHTYGLLEQFNLPLSKITEIGHGIKQDVPEMDKVPNSMIWVSCWSRGLYEALQVINRIDAKKHKIKFDIYGWDEKEESNPQSKTSRTYAAQMTKGKDLRALIGNSPHDITVHSGYQSNEAIEEAWAKADVWLYPTEFVETYCIVALEAQRAGCFTLTSDVGSMPYVNKGGVIINRQTVHHNGLINNTTYWDMFAQHLDHYLSNRELMEPYREQGKAWAKANDLETHIDRWDELLKSIVDSN